MLHKGLPIHETRLKDLLNEKAKIEWMGNWFSPIAILSLYMIDNGESQLKGAKMTDS